MIHKVYGKVASFWKARIVYCIVIAAAMVGLRVVLFDNLFFTPDYVPNHDMYQGAAFFATDMQSMRLNGDLAWWAPQSYTGYAQYYQSFLSPLAPTPGHIVHILWSQLIRLLALVHFAIPEYFQYLIVNYLILPFLTFLGFTLFTSFIFRLRSSLLLAALVYTLSGIGIWNSAWFYFQEPATFFLMMAAVMAVFEHTTVPRLLLLLMMALIQLASFNYWTLYNLFFYVILVVAYICVYPYRVLHTCRTVVKLAKDYKLWTVGIAALVVVVSITWIVLIALIAHEQTDSYIRKIYTEADATARVQEMRTFTTDLFDPVINRSITEYGIFVPIHNARYIGVFLLPFLAVVPFYPWKRKDRWLIFVCVGVLIVCLAPPLLVKLWAIIPFMDRVQHVFYFYTQYWQLMLALLAIRAFEIIVRRQFTPIVQRRLKIVIVAVASLAGVIFVIAELASQYFRLNSLDLQSNLQFALLTLLVSVLVLQVLINPANRFPKGIVMLILLIAFSDLSLYFSVAENVDNKFTTTRWAKVPFVLPTDIQSALQSVWSPPNTEGGFRANLFANMPVPNDFWPNNNFLFPTLTQKLPLSSLAALSGGPALTFYKPTQVVFANNQNTAALITKPESNLTTLILNTTKQVFAIPPNDSTSTAADFSYKYSDWQYNQFGFDVVVPQSGWLAIHQLYDQYWAVTIDGLPVAPQEANFAWMVVPVNSGTHALKMVYNPPSRRLYWFASTFLEIGLLALGGLAIFWSRFKPRRDTRISLRSTK